MWMFEINGEFVHGKIENLLEMIRGNEVLLPPNISYSLKMST